MDRDYPLKPVAIGRRSRRRVALMRHLLKPLVRLQALLPRMAAIRSQVRLAAGLRSPVADQVIDYQVVGGVPSITVGELAATDSPVVLYLHGGAFMLPPVPVAHVNFHARLCRDLKAVGLMPDYRLAPLHRYPAPLDDCERAYRGLLDLGFDPAKIVLAGESAGGNLVLGLLQRIRKAGLPMPACAVPISAVTEMARVHAPPSRSDRARRDPMLPIQAFGKMLIHYAEGCDASDPELSPILADFSGFPPLYFLVGEDEILLDDSLIAARRARQAGVDASVDVWPILPHAFPLFEGLFPEAARAREDIATFARAQLQPAVAAATDVGEGKGEGEGEGRSANGVAQ